MRLLGCLLALLMQGPAMLMQEAAWARMLVRYSAERGVARGVVETFDGRHPCELCHKAEELRHKDDRKDPAERRPAEARLAWAEMLPVVSLRVPAPPAREIAALASPAPEPSVGRGSDEPASPPPERA